MPHDVFISYAAQDKTIVDAVCAGLESRNIRCWIAPRDVLPGMPYAEALIEALNRARIMVLVFSANSNVSGQVLREVERAVNKGIPIIPFRIEDVPPSRSMEYFVSSQHWLDAMTPPLERHIERLGTTVEILLAKESENSVYTGNSAIEDSQKTPPLISPKAEAPSAPRYYCYISHEKVDQLLETSFPARSALELQPSERLGLEQHSASASTGELSYGRPDFLLRNSEVRRSYVRKLNTLADKLNGMTVLFLDGDARQLGGNLFFWFRGPFMVTLFDREAGVATVESDTSRGKLILDCSLRFFSSAVGGNGTFSLNSTNHAFFHGDAPAHFETVFMMVSASVDKYRGSPIYLQLSSSYMTAL